MDMKSVNIFKFGISSKCDAIDGLRYSAEKTCSKD
jgi:hypothetical protein